MRGLVDLSREYLRLPACVGVPEEIDGVTGTSISDPIYTAVVGTLVLAGKYGTSRKQFKLNLSF